MKIKAKNLMLLSIAAAIISVIQSATDIELYLAGTQWMLIAIVLGVYAIYAKRG